MKLFVECSYCKEEESVEITQQDHDRYIYDKELVQKIWPEFSTKQRETLIGYRTGMWWCPNCDEGTATKVATA